MARRETVRKPVQRSGLRAEAQATMMIMRREAMIGRMSTKLKRKIAKITNPAEQLREFNFAVEAEYLAMSKDEREAMSDQHALQLPRRLRRALGDRGGEHGLGRMDVPRG